MQLATQVVCLRSPSKSEAESIRTKAGLYRPVIRGQKKLRSTHCRAAIDVTKLDMVANYIGALIVNTSGEGSSRNVPYAARKCSFSTAPSVKCSVNLQTVFKNCFLLTTAESSQREMAALLPTK
ncbi:hypothetical protein PMIN03_005170 [Paraphaeosphaeria minitans]